MQSIDTQYAGRFFRSRLEARWAAFFDVLKTPWLYELEGYEFKDGTRYLPDFFLPALDAFIEIKPIRPLPAEIEKCRWLAEITGKTVYLFFGNVGFYGYPSGQERSLDYPDSALKFYPDGNEDSSYTWCVCSECGKFGIEFEGRADRICRHGDRDRGDNPDHPLLLKAYDIANSQRFAAW